MRVPRQIPELPQLSRAGPISRLIMRESRRMDGSL